MSAARREKLLLLTLVHPDFLPPVYAAAQTLRDEGYDIHILTFDSFVPSELQLGDHIVLETLGKHHNVSFMQRWKLRRHFLARARQVAGESVKAVMAFCPYSFVYAMKIRKNFPVIFYSIEMADFKLREFFKSPLNKFISYRMLKLVPDADLVATPSIQRSAWLAGRCELEHTPLSILNTAYITADEGDHGVDIFRSIIPAHFADKKIVLYTGAVNDRLCVSELVKAFDILNDPNAALIVTGMKDNDYCKEIKAFAEKSTAKDRILLLPYVTRAEMLSLQHNAHVGICLSKEYEHDLESQMIAPNKAGEYLAKGLYLVATHSVYMVPLQLKGVAVLSESYTPQDISAALGKALVAVGSADCKTAIKSFVKEYFCMQVQLKPVIRFLNK